MKILKYVLFLLVIVGATLFFTLYDPAIIKGRRAYEEYFEKHLTDPESFKVYNEKYTKEGGCITWELDFGARNPMGGMVRKSITFTTINVELFLNERDIQ